LQNFSYQIERGVVVATFAGPITYDLLSGALKTTMSDPNYRLGMPRIVDLSRQTDVMGLDDLMRLADLDLETQGEVKRRQIAVVCADAEFGRIVKLYRDLVMLRPKGQHVEVEFFLNMKAAWAWVEARR